MYKVVFVLKSNLCAKVSLNFYVILVTTNKKQKNKIYLNKSK